MCINVLIVTCTNNLGITDLPNSQVKVYCNTCYPTHYRKKLYRLFRNEYMYSSYKYIIVYIKLYLPMYHKQLKLTVELKI